MAAAELLSNESHATANVSLLASLPKVTNCSFKVEKIQSNKCQSH